MIILHVYQVQMTMADGSYELINVNASVVDHNYFYKEAYEDDFKAIWKSLLGLEIASKSISDSENSELFKYSPYKSLNGEQQNASYDILKKLSLIKNGLYRSMIQINSCAGTVKTILAVYLIKLLTGITINKNV